MLTRAWSWRGTFYILAALGGTLFVSFLLFKDTFRRERSLSYQAAVARLRARLEAKEKAALSNDNSRKVSLEANAPVPVHTLENDEQGVDCVQEPQEPSNREKRAPESTPTGQAGMKDIKLSLKDVNPFPQLLEVFMRKNNTVILFPSCNSSFRTPFTVLTKASSAFRFGVFNLIHVFRDFIRASV